MAKTRSAKPDSKINSADMKTTEIRDLIDFISKTGLNEVNLETKELKLHVKREPDQKVFKSVSAAPVQTVSAPVQQTTQAVAQPQVTKTETPAASGKKTLEIKSPMIGTFYRTANPESA